MKEKARAGLLALLTAMVMSVPVAHALLPVEFYGTLTINNASGVLNVTTGGANITFHINGSDSMNTSVRFGINVTPSSYYMSAVSCNPGDNVSIRVYNVTALLNDSLSGYPCGSSANGINDTTANLNMSSLANGGFCTDHKACRTEICGADYDGTGSWCVAPGTCTHNGVSKLNGYTECSDISTLRTCSSGSWTLTTCTCSNGACASGGGTGTTSGGGTTTPPTETPVTDTAAKGEIIQGITPQDLGLTALTAADVTIKQVGTVLDSTVQTQLAAAVLAVQMATDVDAKAAIEEVKQDVAAGNAVDVKVSLAVYRVESNTTNRNISVSKITVSFTAPKTMKEVKIVQIIPKSIANHISEVTFLSGTPSVLQSDPIVEWSFAEVAQGQTRDMSYTVKKQLSDTSSITTLAAAGEIITPPPAPGGQPAAGNETQPPQQPPSADNTWLYIAIVVVIIIIVLAVVFLRK